MYHIPEPIEVLWKPTAFSPSSPYFLTRDNMWGNMWSIYGLLSPDVYVWIDYYINSSDIPIHQPTYGRLGQEPIIKWTTDSLIYVLEIPSIKMPGVVDTANRLIYGGPPLIQGV